MPAPNYNVNVDELSPRSKDARVLNPLATLVESLVKQRNMRIDSITSFFQDYDAYENRILERWEQEIIFTETSKAIRFDEKLFNDLYTLNSKDVPLKKNQLELKWLNQELRASNSAFFRNLAVLELPR